MQDKEFQLGIIEGFYGAPWSLEARLHYCQWLKHQGYSFYIYAPKADQTLRKNWQQKWHEQELVALQTFRDQAREAGIAFGVGFSPFEIYRNYDSSVRATLQEKIRYIEDVLSPDIVCALFDDMRGDQDSLADLQVRILNDITQWCRARRFIFCPTYYSLDPILEKLFGARPVGYFEKLGKSVDPAIDIFWTGEKICSTEYPKKHLQEIAHLLQRKPFLWDNYPVNDVWEMCDFFYLTPFVNRPYTLAEDLAGHAANIMKQPWMSKIPLSTLPLSYSRKEQYDPDKAFLEVATTCFGQELGSMLVEDADLFSKKGVKQLSGDDADRLRKRYQAFAQQPVAQEVLRWLDGEYAFDETTFAESP